eukprot:TRINITY_DN16309_c0_g1_i1.p1 TRINITY_DN16309_c0_g1~~TRINITY_DN16309_c0_g1_i1.p1  ORF type:complete len:308 (+),score=53.43 TRINITY_DN16309_c0_g1_i1:1167-2090(+)
MLNNIKLNARHMLNFIERGNSIKARLQSIAVTTQKNNKALKNRLLTLASCKFNILKHVNLFLSTWNNEVDLLYAKSKARITANLLIRKQGINFCGIKNVKKLKTKLKKAQGTIAELIDVYRSLRISNMIVTGKDDSGWHAVYKECMKKIEAVIEQKDLVEGGSRNIFEIIQAHANLQLYKSLFEQSPSEEDRKFFSKLQSLEQITSEQLKLNGNFTKSRLWANCIDGALSTTYVDFKRIDAFNSAKAIAEVFHQTAEVLIEGYKVFHNEIRLSTEVTVCVLAYFLIMAKPKMLQSCFKSSFLQTVAT